jgi:hypothetical protein
MRFTQRLILLPLFAAALGSAVATTGCAGPVYERYYDPYDQVQYRWNAGEEWGYRQWELQTHRQHVDFDRRSPTEQHQYWTSPNRRDQRRPDYSRARTR